jgi:hypothetical protein
MKHTFFLALISLLCYPISSYAQFAFVDSTFDDTTKVDRQLSFSYGTNGTKLTLARGEFENMAKGKKAYVVYTGVWPFDSSKANGSNVIDDNTATWIIIDGRGRGSDNSGTYIMIDLQSIRRINRIVIKQPFELANPLLRVRAYTIETGMDSVWMLRVLQQSNNLSTNPDTTFNVISARFVKLTIDTVDPGFNQTVIAEIRVYGVGYLSEGAYVSKPKPALKAVNWETVTWDATLPSAQTLLGFQFRSGNAPIVDNTWSTWSAPITLNNSNLDVDKPRKYIQYRVNLSTTSLETPQLNKIVIYYDTVMTVVRRYSYVVPICYSLSQNYPNPFNPSTTIRYDVPIRSNVKIIITNTLGEEVAVLKNEVEEDGHHEVRWQAVSPSGMYFYRIEAAAVDDPNIYFVDTKKMLLLK